MESGIFAGFALIGMDLLALITVGRCLQQLTMIRFNCTTCGREYLLADALRHLPLLCKGCGHRLVVPDPQPEPISPPPAPQPTVRPEPPRPQKSPSPSDPGSAAEGRLVAAPSVSDSEVDLFMSAELRAKLAAAAGAEPLEPPVPGPSPAPPAREEPANPRPPRKTLAAAADAFVAVLLLALGVFVGEIVAGESTGEILENAGTAPKFPTVELVMWLGCVGFFGLVYAWLGTRGWTLGGWVKRKTTA